jgi:hypothetical protein
MKLHKQNEIQQSLVAKNSKAFKRAVVAEYERERERDFEQRSDSV